MKKLITLTTLALLTSTSVTHAKTVCNVNGGNAKKDMVFDQVLFSGEVTSPKYLFIKKGASKATETPFDLIDTMPQWLELEGQTMVTVGPTTVNNQFGITVGQVDLSKHEGNSLPIHAMAIGQISPHHPLSLTLPVENIEVLCYSLNF